jgi:predicted phage replisome organizer
MSKVKEANTSKVKEYYYFRIVENFFERESIILLQNMKDGYLYSDILLKLYCRCLKHEGRLVYNDRIPYSPEMIASVTRHQVGTAERALRAFEELGLIEVLDNGTIYMSDIQDFIGRSSDEADRKRAYRKRIESEKARISADNGGTNEETNVPPNVGQIPDKSLTEYRDKSIEIKDKKNISTFARSSGKQTSEPEADVEAVILNDGSDWRPSAALYEEYVRLFPAVDVKQQFRLMRSWCLGNSKKRKTRNGIKRFVSSWLTSEQNRGSRKPADNISHQQRLPESGYSQDVFSRLANESRGDAHG